MARGAVDDGADLLLLWGGDGTVQRCIDAVAGSRVTIAVMTRGHRQPPGQQFGPAHQPAGSAQGRSGRGPTPARRRRAQRRAVFGHGRRGFDATLMKDTDSGRKDRLGRVAYVWGGARAVRPNR